MNRFIILFLAVSMQGLCQSLQITEKVKFLALGNSYTIGQSVTTSERWPVQLIDSLRNRGIQCYNASIIATTGWRTDNLRQAIVDANLSPSFNLVSLLIGVNNYYQGRSIETYATEFEELLQMAVELAGGKKENVFVVSIPDYGYTPFGSGNKDYISQGIDAFNSVNEAITKEMGITYVYITDISRRGLDEPDLVASDGLHPSGKMYAEWVERILQSAIIIESPVTSVTGEQNKIRIYPNPFIDQLRIQNKTGHHHYSIQLKDINGKVVQEWQNSNDTELTVLSIESVPSGVYVLTLQEDNKSVMYTRLIKL